MRVLHVLNGPVGGAALSTVTVARELQAYGYEPIAVCNAVGARADQANLERDFPGAVHFTPLHLWNTRSRQSAVRRAAVTARQVALTHACLRSSRVVMEVAERRGVSLIHTNTLTTPEGAIAAIALGVPHIWHQRETVGPQGVQRFLGESGSFARSVERGATLVVANSEFAAKGLHQLGYGGRISVIHNGIEPDRLSHLRDHHRSRSPLTVGMVASPTAIWKDHSTFIRMAGLLRGDPRLTFRIFGRIPSVRESSFSYYRGLIALANDLELGDQFSFAGARMDPCAVMEEVDILVHPTMGEAFGRVLIEAMCAGKAVVAPRGGVGSELTRSGEELMLVDGDPQTLAEAVRLLADSSELRQRLGRAGAALVDACYTNAVLADRIADAYSYALGSAPRSRTSLMQAWSSIYLSRLGFAARSNSEGVST